MRRSLRRIGGVLLLSSALMVSGIALAQETPSTDSSKGEGKRSGPGALFGNMIRGDLVVQTPEGVKKIHVERGKASNISDDSFTLSAADGKNITIKTDSKTLYRPKGTELASLDGKNVLVITRKKDGDAYIARVVALAREKGKGSDRPDKGKPTSEPTNSG